MRACLETCSSAGVVPTVSTAKEFLEALKDQSPEWVVHGRDKSAHNEEVQMLKEVDLAAHGVVEVEPSTVRELLREVAIASVRVAILRCLC